MQQQCLKSTILSRYCLAEKLSACIQPLLLSIFSVLVLFNIQQIISQCHWMCLLELNCELIKLLFAKFGKTDVNKNLLSKFNRSRVWKWFKIKIKVSLMKNFMQTFLVLNEFLHHFWSLRTFFCSKIFCI